MKRARNQTVAPTLKLSSHRELAQLLRLSPGELKAVAAKSASMYVSFEIPKSDGTSRTIRPPRRRLRIIQRNLLRLLTQHVKFPPWVTGGVEGRSIFDHASPHVGSFMVATMDLTNFFPSTTSVMASQALSRFGISDDALATTLGLVTLESQLPQGAPTSGFLANLAMDEADRRIASLCRRNALEYTRYVDDLAFSGPVDFEGLKGQFQEAVERHGYRIAKHKTHFMTRESPQIVTKLRVNEKLRPTGPFLNELRELVWLCVNHGPAIAAVGEGLTVRALKNRVTGRVLHVAQADPRLGKRLRGLLCGVDWASRRIRPATIVAETGRSH